MGRLIESAYRPKPERRLIPLGGQENSYSVLGTLIRPLGRESKIAFVKTYQPEVSVQQADEVVINKDTSFVVRVRRFLNR